MGVCSLCQPLFVLLEREQSEGSSSHPSALHGAALGCCKARDEAALSAGVVQCCHGTFMELPGSSGQGMFPQPQTGSPSPGSCSCPAISQGGFSSPTHLATQGRSPVSLPCQQLTTQQPFQMFVPRDPQVPQQLHPHAGTVSGCPSLRSVLITFIQCNQGKESIDSLSSHFCQFFRRHH